MKETLRVSKTEPQLNIDNLSLPLYLLISLSFKIDVSKL